MLRKKKSNQIIFCLVVLGLMIFNLSIFFPNIFATEYSVARIVSVDYPKSVEPSQSFHIFVEAEYQDSFYIDIGIRNLKKDEFLQSLTSINEFYGPGKEDFIFNLTSPPKEGDLQLEATTRAWWRNAWFADPNQGTMKFVIRVIEPSEKEIELAANQTIQVFENDRLRFIGWSDGVNSNPRKIWANYEDTIAPIYRRQFFLKISSQLNFIEGQGWYDENDNATLEAPSRIPFEEKIYLFKGWQGDIKSSKPLVETKMNGKKEVQATWVEMSNEKSIASYFIYLISSSLLVASIITTIAIAIKRMKKRALTLVLISIVLASLSAPTVRADIDEGVEYEKVEIGESVWRYWKNPGSDTCLIWLGGGIFTQQLFINPYSLESYNTMYFIQDLSRFYSVLAIEEGSKERLQAVLKRNIKGEIYEGSTFIEDARNWLLKTGYSQIYMVGYSVGGVAAAREGIRERAGRWQSPNGMILITTPKDKTIWNKAEKLQGNMLLLYGEKMTGSFIEAGNDLIDKTPNEGPQNLGWLHKEIIVLPEVAHEVWTIAESGTYSSKAVSVIVEFIEESKVLYYLKVNEKQSSDIESKEEEYFVKTFVEPCLNPKEPMRLRMKIEGLHPDNYTFVAKPLVEGIKLSVTKMAILKNENEALLIFNQIPKKPFKFELFSYSNSTNYLGTYEAACKSSITIKVTKSFDEIPILVDGVEYEIGKDGKLELETYVGKHIIELPLDINLTPEARTHFKGWADGSNDTRISIETPGNTNLLAIYAKQFLVEGYSDRGSVSGNGWYDENSLSSLKMKNRIIEDEESIFIFKGWNINGEDEISEQIYVTEPVKAEAKWRRIELPIVSNKFELIIPLFFLIFSITIFSITIFFARKYR